MGGFLRIMRGVALDHPHFGPPTGKIGPLGEAIQRPILAILTGRANEPQYIDLEELTHHDINGAGLHGNGCLKPFSSWLKSSQNFLRFHEISGTIEGN
jgi:hypothetical protein